MISKRSWLFDVAWLMASLALAATLVTLLHWPVEVSRPIRINVRWSPLAAEARRGAEAELGLRDGVLTEGRTWQYTIDDTSHAALERIVRHRHVEDTHGINRETMTLVSHDTSDAARGQLRPKPPALIATAWRDAAATPRTAVGLIAFAMSLVWLLPSGQRLGQWLSGTVPSVGGAGFRLFRLAFGLALAASVWTTPFTPAVPIPIDLQRNVDWFADWPPIRALVMHPSAIRALVWCTVMAFVAFALGWTPRRAYVAAVLATTVLVLAKLRMNSSHDWGLPLVTLWALLPVPWARLVDKPSRRLGYAVWLPSLTLGLAFAAAAMAKLRESGWSWVTTGAVRFHFVEDAGAAQSDVALWIASHESFAVALSGLVILTEMALLAGAFVRHPLARMVVGCAGASILLGFKVMQGVFWPAWWALLLSYLPWDVIARSRAPQGESALSRTQLKTVAALVVVQLGVTIAGIEHEPLLSNFPMYAKTHASTDAFNREYADESRAYLFYTIDKSGCGRDVTQSIDTTPTLLPQARRMIERLVRGEPAAPDAAKALAQALMNASGPHAAVGEPFEVAVYATSKQFDFDRGQFTQLRTRPVARFRDASLVRSDQPVNVCK